MRDKTRIKPWMIGAFAMIILCGISLATITIKPGRFSAGIQMVPQAHWSGGSGDGGLGIAGLYYNDDGGAMIRKPDNTEFHIPTSGGGGSGTVTSITAGTGLTGGTISTSGTIAVSTAMGQSMAPTDNTYSFGDTTHRLSSVGTKIVTSGNVPLKLWDGTNGVNVTFGSSEQIIQSTANDIYIRDSSNNGFVAQNAVGGGYLSVGGANTFGFRSTGFYPTTNASGGIGIASHSWLFGMFGAVVGSQPTCDSTMRNAFYVVDAVGGASDILEVCMKSAADTYAWRTVFTAP